MRAIILSGLAIASLASCPFPAPTYNGPARSFETSFESVDEYLALGFYNEPGPAFASDSSLSAEQVKHGSFSHKAWITAARDVDNESTPGYVPHRAYPTFQFQETPEGVLRTPCLVSLWVCLDFPPLAERPGQVDDWFSFATLSPDPSDSWSRTVLVNVVHDGYLRLVHVPDQGEQEWIFQAEAANDPHGLLRFPSRQWVRIDVYIDFDADVGTARVWQDGHLVSHALVRGGNGGLAQVHFGLYASAAIASGTVYNDRLRIREVSGEAEAAALVAADW